jgi:hypothetical protein
VTLSRSTGACSGRIGSRIRVLRDGGTGEVAMDAGSSIATHLLHRGDWRCGARWMGYSGAATRREAARGDGGKV